MKNVNLAAIFAASLLASAIPVVAAPSESDVQGTISSYQGAVEFAAPGSSQFRPVSQEAPIPRGSILRTGSNGMITLVPFPGAAMTLSPNTELNLATMNIATENRAIAKKTALLDLKQGMVTVVIDHNAAQKIPVDFKVKTPSSIASAVGTQYVVAIIGGKTYVKVLEGSVQFGGIGGAPVAVTSETGVAVFGNGQVTFASNQSLPADVVLALNAAPVLQTNGPALIGAGLPGLILGLTGGQTFNPRNTLLDAQVVSPAQ